MTSSFGDSAPPARRAGRVLMIEDDFRLASMVRTYLAGHGYDVVVADDAESGLRQVTAKPFDAVLLDLMLPDADGLEVCRNLRARSDVPILMVTARGDMADRIVGLELGADDYIAKPFDPRELLARLRAVTRRSTNGARRAAGGAPILQFGRLEIDRAARRVRVDGHDRDLTSRQFDLLVLLAERAGRVLSRDALIAELGDEASDAMARTVDVHIARIRAAIEDDARNPRRVITVRGAGYVFAQSQD
jgi:DNA-binding response OmpR family regulator